ncbi:MAG: hypothetical protein A2147_08070 [Chloroflexi bacterium RBG_16_57_8]|nr:MAG: hypothetical protein A2147_08070 [Chloroflexi bacterium RBG_16_57_8]
MNKEQYLEYVARFNNKQYDAVTGYFTPDVTVEYYDNATYSGPPARTLHGAKAFIDHYRSLHEHTREALELGAFIYKDNMLFVELYTEFHTFKDPPPSSGRTWKKGDVTIMTNFVLYDLERGKMKRIRIAHFRMHDPKTAKL